MIQVWLYDENKVYIESRFVEVLTENMTTIPFEVGYVKPTFNEELEEWFEGATQEEIEKWEEINNQQSEPDKMEVLEKQLRQQEEAIGLIATHVAKNTLLNGGV